jgi:hypothetical protein
LRVPSANPPVNDRINCLKRRAFEITPASGLWIDPKCKQLIKDQS